jgi:hypothetical protein
MTPSLHPYLRVTVLHPAPIYASKDTIEIKGAGPANQNLLMLTFDDARWLAQILRDLTAHTPPDLTATIQAGDPPAEA